MGNEDKYLQIALEDVKDIILIYLDTFYSLVSIYYHLCPKY